MSVVPRRMPNSGKFMKFLCEFGNESAFDTCALSDTQQFFGTKSAKNTSPTEMQPAGIVFDPCMGQMTGSPFNFVSKMFKKCIFSRGIPGTFQESGNSEF